MLKYNDIISKMTDAQKIRLVCGVGSLEGKDFKVLGIPTLKAENIKDYLTNIYPHTAMLAHSWNRRLWDEVTEDRILAMAEDGVNFSVVSGPKIKLCPYRKEISEDPYLAREMTASEIGAVDRLGLASAASGYYLTESDISWLDFEPDERVINEYVVKPYRTVLSPKIAKAVITDLRPMDEAYMNAGRDMLNSISDEAEFLVVPRATEENTVELISKGVICLAASENAVELALARGRRLKKQMESGAVTEEQLNESADGDESISEEQLDFAADKVLDLLFRCKRESFSLKKHSGNEQLGLLASLESSVLLKNNDKVLPLREGERIAIIGNAKFDSDSAGDASRKCAEELEKRGFTVSGYADGYDESLPSDRYQLDEAEALAKRSDIVVLFMGFGRSKEKSITKTERLTLPARQLKLAHVLSRMGKKIVAVISSAHAPDVDFTRLVDGVLIAPLETNAGVTATAKILSGEYNPSGKLAYTLYASSATAFEKRLVYKHNHGIKNGQFIGYRYYDTADMYVGYPFGHGLSYTDFKYGDLSVKGGAVSFSVENVGDVTGTETVQVYVGKKDSSVQRPKKVLAGFEKITLEPGEKARISIVPEIPAVYSDGRFITEDGKYEVYVGSSVSDVRLEGSVKVSGERLPEDGKRLSDYLQTVSNVKEDNYTLEADYKSMKKSVKNILFGIGALAIAIAVGVFNALLSKPYMFLGIVAGILAASSIIFFIIEAVERSRSYAKEREMIDEANKEYFKEAEEIEVLSTDRMFKDEFDVEDEEERRPEVTDSFIDDGHAAFINPDFTLSSAIEEFKRFSEERGYRFAENVVENLITSFATSKLLVLNGLSSQDFNSVMLLIGEYFGSNTYIDVLEKKETVSFAGYDVHDDYAKKNAVLALEDASTAPDKMQFTAFDGIKAENIEDALRPFMGYLSHAKDKNEIFIFNEIGVNVGHTLSKNLWVVLNLVPGERVDSLPQSIVDTASVVNVSFTKIKPVDGAMYSHGFSRYQLEYILEKEAGMNEVPEDVWKKIDKLEKYAAKLSGYRIGNKAWRRFEKHLGLLLAAGIPLSEATDIAVSAKLAMSVMAAIEGKTAEDEPAIGEMIDVIFGEENTAYCKNVMGTVSSLNSSTAQKENAAEQDGETQSGEEQNNEE